ncbi:MAG: DNA repair protein RadC [Pseudomonadota bacterium]|nr:DNA repair protein RadC [Pseudomonadota bacterium]
MIDDPHYLGHRDRARDKFLATGGEGMADYEILELLLFIAIPRRDVKPLAKELIEHFGSFGSVLSAPVESLEHIPGLGRTAIAAIKTVTAASTRLARERVVKRPILASWSSLLDYIRVSMGFESVEQFRILFLNRKNMLIADEVQQRGTVDHTPAYPREVVRRALELGATAIILVHNHPTGDVTPSRDDIEMTKRIIKAAEAVGITVIDHLVVGRGDIASFKDLTLL